MHILIVDPHEPFRQALADLITELCRSDASEVHVAHTADPESAASLLTKVPLTLALVDITLGTQGRPSLISRLIALRGDLVVIAMAGDDDPVLAAAARRAGATILIGKAAGPRRLAAHVREALETSRRRQDN